MNKKILFITLPLAVAALLTAGLLRTDYGIIAFKRLAMVPHSFIIGKKNWIFYRGELEYALLPWNNAAKKLAVIDSIAKENGVSLIIVPIPNKIDMYPELLDTRLKRDIPFLTRRSADFMKRLENCSVLNLYERYRTARDTMPLFEADESHATSHGIRIAVDETMRRFFPSEWGKSDSCLKYKMVSFTGNLTKETNLVPVQRDINICYDSCGNETGSKDTILVIGDSYTFYLNEYQGSYCDLLKGRLGGRFNFRIYSRVDAGFRLSEKLLPLIQKNRRYKKIIWIFTAREFYKPLGIPASVRAGR